MSKEIKFRSWDVSPLEGESKMIYGIDKIKEHYDGISLIDELLNPEESGIPEIRIMQFIRLKDKKGKEIYEGDIVKSHQKDENIEKGEPYIIEYCDGEFCFKEPGDGLIFSGQDLQIRSSQWLKVEVIGNIYENPELLKDSHKEAKK